MNLDSDFVACVGDDTCPKSFTHEYYPVEINTELKNVCFIEIYVRLV